MQDPIFRSAAYRLMLDGTGADLIYSGRGSDGVC